MATVAASEHTALCCASFRFPRIGESACGGAAAVTDMAVTENTTSRAPDSNGCGRNTWTNVDRQRGQDGALLVDESWARMCPESRQVECHLDCLWTADMRRVSGSNPPSTTRRFRAITCPVSQSVSRKQAARTDQAISTQTPVSYVQSSVSAKTQGFPYEAFLASRPATLIVCFSGSLWGATNPDGYHAPPLHHRPYRLRRALVGAGCIPVHHTMVPTLLLQMRLDPRCNGCSGELHAARAARACRAQHGGAWRSIRQTVTAGVAQKRPL